jgi:hypothetical protein
MTTERYWVVGGQYSCTRFSEMNGAPQALGPYGTREEAKEVWKRLSQETRSQATTRYAIAAEQIVLPA